MKRILFILLACVAPTLATQSPYEGTRSGETVLHVRDTNIGTSLEILNEDSEEFAQMAADTMIKVTNNGAAAARVHVMAIQTDSTVLDTSFSVGAAATVETLVGQKVHAFLQAYVTGDESSGTIDIFSSDDTFANSRLTQIAANQLHAPIGHWMTDKFKPTIIRSVTFKHESVTDSTAWELRVYPSIEDTRDLTDGYYRIATARLHQGHPVHTETLDHSVDGASLIAVFSSAASSSLAGTKGSTVLRLGGWRR